MSLDNQTPQSQKVNIHSEEALLDPIIGLARSIDKMQLPSAHKKLIIKKLTNIFPDQKQLYGHLLTSHINFYLGDTQETAKRLVAENLSSTESKLMLHPEFIRAASGLGDLDRTVRPEMLLELYLYRSSSDALQKLVAEQNLTDGGDRLTLDELHAYIVAKIMRAEPGVTLMPETREISDEINGLFNNQVMQELKSQNVLNAGDTLSIKSPELKINPRKEVGESIERILDNVDSRIDTPDAQVALVNLLKDIHRWRQEQVQGVQGKPEQAINRFLHNLNKALEAYEGDNVFERLLVFIAKNKCESTQILISQLKDLASSLNNVDEDLIRSSLSLLLLGPTRSIAISVDQVNNFKDVVDAKQDGVKEKIDEVKNGLNKLDRDLVSALTPSGVRVSTESLWITDNSAKQGIQKIKNKLRHILKDAKFTDYSQRVQSLPTNRKAFTKALGVIIFDLIRDQSLAASEMSTVLGGIVSLGGSYPSGPPYNEDALKTRYTYFKILSEALAECELFEVGTTITNPQIAGLQYDSSSLIDRDPFPMVMSPAEKLSTEWLSQNAVSHTELTQEGVDAFITKYSTLISDWQQSSNPDQFVRSRFKGIILPVDEPDDSLPVVATFYMQVKATISRIYAYMKQSDKDKYQDFLLEVDRILNQAMAVAISNHLDQQGVAVLPEERLDANFEWLELYLANNQPELSGVRKDITFWHLSEDLRDLRFAMSRQHQVDVNRRSAQIESNLQKCSESLDSVNHTERRNLFGDKDFEIQMILMRERGDYIMAEKLLDELANESRQLLDGVDIALAEETIVTVRDDLNSQVSHLPKTHLARLQNQLSILEERTKQARIYIDELQYYIDQSTTKEEKIANIKRENRTAQEVEDQINQITGAPPSARDTLKDKISLDREGFRKTTLQLYGFRRQGWSAIGSEQPSQDVYRAIREYVLIRLLNGDNNRPNGDTSQIFALVVNYIHDLSYLSGEEGIDNVWNLIQEDWRLADVKGTSLIGTDVEITSLRRVDLKKSLSERQFQYGVIYVLMDLFNQDGIGPQSISSYQANLLHHSLGYDVRPQQINPDLEFPRATRINATIRDLNLFQRIRRKPEPQVDQEQFNNEERIYAELAPFIEVESNYTVQQIDNIFKGDTVLSDFDSVMSVLRVDFDDQSWGSEMFVRQVQDRIVHLRKVLGEALQVAKQGNLQIFGRDASRVEEDIRRWSKVLDYCTVRFIGETIDNRYDFSNLDSYFASNPFIEIVGRLYSDDIAEPEKLEMANYLTTLFSSTYNGSNQIVSQVFTQPMSDEQRKLVWAELQSLLMLIPEVSGRVESIRRKYMNEAMGMKLDIHNIGELCDHYTSAERDINNLFASEYEKQTPNITSLHKLVKRIDPARTDISEEGISARISALNGIITNRSAPADPPNGVSVNIPDTREAEWIFAGAINSDFYPSLSSELGARRQELDSASSEFSEIIGDKSQGDPSLYQQIYDQLIELIETKISGVAHPALAELSLLLNQVFDLDLEVDQDNQLNPSDFQLDDMDQLQDYYQKVIDLLDDPSSTLGLEIDSTVLAKMRELFEARVNGIVTEVVLSEAQWRLEQVDIEKSQLGHRAIISIWATKVGEDTQSFHELPIIDMVRQVKEGQFEDVDLEKLLYLSKDKFQRIFDWMHNDSRIAGIESDQDRMRLKQFIYSHLLIPEKAIGAWSAENALNTEVGITSASEVNLESLESKAIVGESPADKERRDIKLRSAIRNRLDLANTLDELYDSLEYKRISLLTGDIKKEISAQDFAKAANSMVELQLEVQRITNRVNKIYSACELRVGQADYQTTSQQISWIQRQLERLPNEYRIASHQFRDPLIAKWRSYVEWNSDPGVEKIEHNFDIKSSELETKRLQLNELMGSILDVETSLSKKPELNKVARVRAIFSSGRSFNYERIIHDMRGDKRLFEGTKSIDPGQQVEIELESEQNSFVIKNEGGLLAVLDDPDSMVPIAYINPDDLSKGVVERKLGDEYVMYIKPKKKVVRGILSRSELLANRVYRMPNQQEYEIIIFENNYSPNIQKAPNLDFEIPVIDPEDLDGSREDGTQSHDDLWSADGLFDDQADGDESSDAILMSEYQTPPPSPTVIQEERMFMRPEASDDEGNPAVSEASTPKSDSDSNDFSSKTEELTESIKQLDEDIDLTVLSSQAMQVEKLVGELTDEESEGELHEFEDIQEGVTAESKEKLTLGGNEFIARVETGKDWGGDFLGQNIVKSEDLEPVRVPEIFSNYTVYSLNRQTLREFKETLKDNQHVFDDLISAAVFRNCLIGNIDFSDSLLKESYDPVYVIGNVVSWESFREVIGSQSDIDPAINRIDTLLRIIGRVSQDIVIFAKLIEILRVTREKISQSTDISYNNVRLNVNLTEYLKRIGKTSIQLSNIYLDYARQSEELDHDQARELLIELGFMPPYNTSSPTPDGDGPDDGGGEPQQQEEAEAQVTVTDGGTSENPANKDDKEESSKQGYEKLAAEVNRIGNKIENQESVSDPERILYNLVMRESKGEFEEMVQVPDRGIFFSKENRNQPSLESLKDNYYRVKKMIRDNAEEDNTSEELDRILQALRVDAVKAFVSFTDDERPRYDIGDRELEEFVLQVLIPQGFFDPDSDLDRNIRAGYRKSLSEYIRKLFISGMQPSYGNIANNRDFIREIFFIPYDLEADSDKPLEGPKTPPEQQTSTEKPPQTIEAERGTSTPLENSAELATSASETVIENINQNLEVKLDLLRSLQDGEITLESVSNVLEGDNLLEVIQQYQELQGAIDNQESEIRKILSRMLIVKLYDTLSKNVEDKFLTNIYNINGKTSSELKPVLKEIGEAMLNKESTLTDVFEQQSENSMKQLFIELLDAIENELSNSQVDRLYAREIRTVLRDNLLTNPGFVKEWLVFRNRFINEESLNRNHLILSASPELNQELKDVLDPLDNIVEAISSEKEVDKLIYLRDQYIQQLEQLRNLLISDNKFRRLSFQGELESLGEINSIELCQQFYKLLYDNTDGFSINNRAYSSYQKLRLNIIDWGENPKDVAKETDKELLNTRFKILQDTGINWMTRFIYLEKLKDLTTNSESQQDSSGESIPPKGVDDNTPKYKRDKDSGDGWVEATQPDDDGNGIPNWIEEVNNEFEEQINDILSRIDLVEIVEQSGEHEVIQGTNYNERALIRLLAKQDLGTNFGGINDQWRDNHKDYFLANNAFLEEDFENITIDELRERVQYVFDSLSKSQIEDKESLLDQAREQAEAVFMSKNLGDEEGMKQFITSLFSGTSELQRSDTVQPQTSEVVKEKMSIRQAFEDSIRVVEDGSPTQIRLQLLKSQLDLADLVQRNNPYAAPIGEDLNYEMQSLTEGMRNLSADLNLVHDETVRMELIRLGRQAIYEELRFFFEINPKQHYKVLFPAESKPRIMHMVSFVQSFAEMDFSGEDPMDVSIKLMLMRLINSKEFQRFLEYFSDEQKTFILRDLILPQGLNWDKVINGFKSNTDFEIDLSINSAVDSKGVPLLETDQVADGDQAINVDRVSNTGINLDNLNLENSKISQSYGAIMGMQNPARETIIANLNALLDSIDSSLGNLDPSGEIRLVSKRLTEDSTLEDIKYITNQLDMNSSLYIREIRTAHDGGYDMRSDAIKLLKKNRIELAQDNLKDEGDRFNPVKIQYQNVVKKISASVEALSSNQKDRDAKIESNLKASEQAYIDFVRENPGSSDREKTKQIRENLWTAFIESVKGEGRGIEDLNNIELLGFSARLLHNMISALSNEKLRLDVPSLAQLVCPQELIERFNPMDFETIQSFHKAGAQYMMIYYPHSEMVAELAIGLDPEKISDSEDVRRLKQKYKLLAESLRYFESTTVLDEDTRNTLVSVYNQISSSELKDLFFKAIEAIDITNFSDADATEFINSIGATVEDLPNLYNRQYGNPFGYDEYLGILIRVIGEHNDVNLQTIYRFHEPSEVKSLGKKLKVLRFIPPIEDEN